MEGRLFFIRLSRCLKNYLSQRFGLPALSFTTGELIQALGKREPESALKRILEVLHSADLVKFSDRTSDRRDLSRVLGDVSDTIREVEEYVEP